MSTMYIRVRRDGFIYDWNPILAKNPDCEVITEEEAYPERFIQPAVVEQVKLERKKRTGALDLGTSDIPEAPPYTSPELAAEAARGMPA